MTSHVKSEKTNIMIDLAKIQKSSFPDGGFVLHKIPFNEKSRISAWYDKDGKILDAEFMPSGRKVKTDGPAWRKAKSYGKTYSK